MKMHHHIVILFVLLVAAFSSHAQQVGTTASGQALALTVSPDVSDNTKVKPFGYELFAGQLSTDKRDGINPNYRVMPGDQITVSLWGAVTFNQVLEVDNQGNIFIPDVGPITVGGIHHASINQVVSEAVGLIYRDNVEVYTNLRGTQPISIFVTGNVRSPGRYGGVASDTMLHFIDRARGIDPERGSFRTIDLLRDGEVITTIDIYAFLTKGVLPNVQLVDGDTILVHPRGSTIAVEGDARQLSGFEFMEEEVPGHKILALARPLPGATHAVLRGTRNNKPVSAYVTLEQFKTYSFMDGDSVEFTASELSNSIKVNVEGQHNGERVVILPLGSNLSDVLNLIPVNPKLANIDAVYLERKSVALRQKEALEESLKRLEESVLVGVSRNTTEASIRANEAALISQFVLRAKETKPRGRVVVMTEGKFHDIPLEHDDSIYIPAKTNVVLVNGEVTIPKAIVHQDGLDVDDYIERAGGFGERADTDKVVVVRANGEAVVADNPTVRPGDEILVLPKVVDQDLQYAKDVAEIVYSIAIAALLPFSID